jgi:hypothetical protein
MIRRNRRGRFAKQRVASRWERIICLSILGGIALGIGLDVLISRESHYVYAKEPVVEVPKEVQIAVHIDWTEERIKQEIAAVAKKYKVSEDKMRETIQCESHFVTDIQSHHLYSFTDATRGIYAGEREQSYGLSQIHLPDHPKVTYEQAIDPKFAINFMGKAFANGYAYWWTCARDLGYTN